MLIARSMLVCHRCASRATTSQRIDCGNSWWSGIARAIDSATSAVVAVLVMKEYLLEVVSSSQWLPLALGIVDAVRSLSSPRTGASTGFEPPSRGALAGDARPPFAWRA